MNCKIEVEKEMKELTVLKSELSNIRKGAKVYQKQQNSNIFFLSDKEKLFQKAKQNLDDLVLEYKHYETTEPSPDQNKGC